MREENMPGVGRSLVRAWMRAALVVTFTLVLTSSLTSISWAKPRYKTLHTFTKKLAHFPVAGLVADPLGNLYGTTLSGGSNGAGTVFELAPNDHGGWTETVLHSFNYADGANPRSSLVFDSAGNLYGTTADGGASGAGTVFKLVLDSHGAWNETILHSFTFNGVDGFYPYAGLISDSAGNLFGTTQSGGASGDGTVFELVPDSHGGWREIILYSFNRNGTDGYDSAAGLIFDSAGNLYGTTVRGGANGAGTVFELAPDGREGWNETILHSFTFNGTDGFEPYAALVFHAGYFYGTTGGGGAKGYGTVFELAPDGHGGWTETILHSFNLRDEGAYPLASLIFDAEGNLYGTTERSSASGDGTVFELAPDGHGGWAEKVLHRFKNRPGALPSGNLVFGLLGHLYGTTSGDGQVTWGSVFEVAP